MGSVAYAQEKPMLELGVFLASAMLPDYPAADQSRSRTIPAPLVYYHGDFLRADEKDGARFRFINVDKFDLDLSFGGSFPTDTGNNQARAGMPNLDWTAEIGPRLIYYFYRDPQVAQIRLGIPIRANFSTNFVKLAGVGYVVAPSFEIEKYNVFTESLNLVFHYSPSYISEGIANYFYGIVPQYQSPERTAYEAKAGFLGHEVAVAVKYRVGSNHFLAGAQYTNFSQSANRQSYLHRSSVNWSFVLAVSWVLYQSEGPP